MIDVDDRATWPEPVVAWVDAKAEQLTGTTEHTLDLNVSHSEDVEFRRLLASDLLAYHCTRLLGHEVDWVRRDGLLLLTEDLVKRRIDGAYEHDHITRDGRDELMRSHAFAAGQRDRGDKTHLILGRTSFDEKNGGCETLLATWGGEAIYNITPGIEEKYGHLGEPAIVVVGFDASPEVDFMSFPDVSKVFIGTLLGTWPLVADIVQPAPIRPARVLDVWQPGNPQYDRHPHLPRQ